MTLLEKLKAANEARTRGEWRWLSHDCFTEGEKRVWRYVESDFKYDQERQLTNASPGDLHEYSKGEPPILSAVSTGYGGECDISINESNASFICLAANHFEALLAVVESLRDWNSNSTYKDDFHRDTCACMHAIMPCDCGADTVIAALKYFTKPESP